MKLKVLYLLLMFATLTSGLWAQDLSKLYIVGSAKHEPGELINRSVKDINQMVCAGLIIYSDLEGLTYQANNEIVKINRLPGKDFLFIQSEERVVTIFKTGYAPLKIILNEYGIKLAEGKVYSITVTGDKPKILGIIPVNFQITPTDAEILINNKSYGIERTISLDPGTYDVIIKREGYEQYSSKIEITEKKNLFQIALKEVELQPVTINSTPTGATITIDGIEKGETNKGLFLYPGSYAIRLSKSGYLQREETIQVAVNKPNSFSYALTKNVGTITVTATPSDVNITINRERVNNGTATELAPGKYKIEVTREGYYPEDKTVELSLGGTIKESFMLKAKVGKLQFSIAPPEATVTLTRGGKTERNWQGLSIQKDIPVGTYELTAKAPGHKTFTKTVTITENQTTVEDVQMKQGSDAPEGFVFVEGGTFQMGSNNGDSDEKPVHQVTLSDYYISKYEVTQKEWIEVMGSNPSNFKGDNLPVEQVSWNEIQTFIQKLNQKAGGNYRLPTEAEWEYAARGGNKSQGYTYSGSNNIDEVGWYDNNSGSKTHPVGTKKPNELGIYDMSGNVWEWVQDWYGTYPSSAQVNPTGPSTGSYRVLRGGSWYSLDSYCRVAIRVNYAPDIRSSNGGFRLVQDK